LPIFCFQKFGEFLQFSLIFFCCHNAKICPQNICCLWCTLNTIKAQMTFICLRISYEPPDITLMRKWLSFKLI
jgi:hypothetical protein